MGHIGPDGTILLKGIEEFKVSFIWIINYHLFVLLMGDYCSKIVGQ